MTTRSMARLLLFSRLLRRFDLQQLAALGLVGLGADRAGHLEPLAAQKIGCPARPARMVGYRDDDPILGNFGKVFLQFPYLDAEVDGEATDRGNFVRPPKIQQKNAIRTRQQVVELRAV